jgi:hypothetical protein
MAWSRRLIPPLVLKDGRELKTLSDAREMILGLLEKQKRAPYWQQAAELLRYPAENDKEAIDDMRAQLMRALYTDGFV